MRGATLFAGLLAHFAFAAPGPLVEEKRQTPGCEFDSATTPECWKADLPYNLNSNYYEEGPDTGRERFYKFELTNLEMSPDGVKKMVLAINGQIPGPTIEADWGDTVGMFNEWGSSLGTGSGDYSNIDLANLNRKTSRRGDKPPHAR